MGGPYHGKDGAIYFDQYNLTGQSSNVSVGQTVPTAEITVLGASAQTHLAGVPAWTGTVNSFWDDTATTGVEDVYRNALSASGIISFYPAGTTIGYRGRGCVGELETGYTVTSPVAGAVTAEVTLTGNGDLEAIRCTGGSTSTNTGASAALTSYDYSASSTSQALAGYLHVTAIAGADPSVTFTHQESSDNSAFTDLWSFTAVTAVTKERKTLSASVARYVRTKYTLNASTTSVTFMTGFHRDEPVS